MNIIAILYKEIIILDQILYALSLNLILMINLTAIPNGVKCTLPYTNRNMYQCILDGAFYNISKPKIPEITQTSSESSSVPQTTATTPVKGSLSTMSITASKETLSTPINHDITRTTQSSSTSKSPIVSPDEISPSQENIESATSLSSSSEIDATPTNPNNGNMSFQVVTFRHHFKFFSQKIQFLTRFVWVLNANDLNKRNTEAEKKMITMSEKKINDFMNTIQLNMHQI